ncbi:hypothetical protein NTD84_07450 [Pseudomonas sp. 14P_8.1_Bac3]|uniref:hypothetical protein n=1 Tax=Pseudomonas sp. 14P_8.1_Bac3 TaxID=2971621 RepID=UPI0021C6E1E5|nr:hypothetical protein [Pseudomonas sp. 14P_8.1_Bac3]MCU1759558.1 hypothetical protein [Pseudomonas sp. 14P_8.1_Bac3]
MCISSAADNCRHPVVCEEGAHGLNGYRRIVYRAALANQAAALATFSPSMSPAAEVLRFGIKPNVFNNIGFPLRNNLTSGRCVTVLNHQVTKNRHLKTTTRPSPQTPSSPNIDQWVKLFSTLYKLPRARKPRAYRMNNVLDFA